MRAPEIRSIHRLRRQRRQQRRITTRLAVVFALIASVVWAPGSSAQDAEPAPAAAEAGTAAESTATPEATQTAAAAEATQPAAAAAGTVEPLSIVAPPADEPVDERAALCAAWNAVESTFGLPPDSTTAVNALDAALSDPGPPGLDLAMDDLRAAIRTIDGSLATLGGYIGGICESLVPTTIEFDGTIATVTGSCLTTPVIGAQDRHYVLNGDDFFGVMTFHSDEEFLFVTVTTETDVWESSLITTEEFGVGFVIFTEPDDSNPAQIRVDFDLTNVPVDACDNLAVCRDLLAMWDALILLADAQMRLETSTGAAPVEIGAIDEDLGYLANVVTFCLPPTAMSIEEHLANGGAPADADGS